ncbi:Sterol esterase [Pleurostoma richardsiae]|uniref:Carboxylic ester hydrolase n=1 Tax=Pleurostoma richardsiae TaxID=41990 RepID=A0AA38RM50_9PEZI|nr:Sterol esterase [Pleurostoma richardsiae]
MLAATGHETLHHPTIGRIRGMRRSPEVDQYLGIQYATLKDRFSRGELPQYDPSDTDGALNATKFGPLPLSSPKSCELEYGHIQKSLPYTPLPQSDTKCLTLNISAPSSSGPGKFPVMVIVHGGAFTAGSSSFPQYDLFRITQMSVSLGMPVVSVGINYRLGAPGFLYSGAMKQAGYKPNNGLDDQRLALLWIKHHISGFGGDPDSVTLVGESAGAVSGCFHLHSPEPLFHQLVAMSGTSIPRRKPVEQGKVSYNSVVEVLGAKRLSPTGQIQRLLDTSREDFVNSVGRRFPIGPLIEGDIIPQSTSFMALSDSGELLKLFPGLLRCKRVLMADCQMDGMIFNARVAGRTDILATTLGRCLSTIFNPIDSKIAPAILSAYRVDVSATANTRETIEPILNLGNDIMFALPTRAFVKAWAAASIAGTEAFLAHFNCPNPWDGPWNGHATHILDIAFVLQNYRESLSGGQAQCAERYAKDIIAFVNGMSPWTAYQDIVSPGSMVYFAAEHSSKDDSRFVSTEAPELTGRRDYIQTIVGEKLFDKLADAWDMFMAAPR